MNIRKIRKAIQKKTKASLMARFAVIIVLSILYFLAALLGEVLVKPLEYTFWPTTGLALSFILLLGYRVWPGIFLGALIYYTNYSHFTGWENILIAFIKASAIASEVCLAGYLVRKYIKTNDLLYKGNRIIFFIAIAVIASLIGPTATVLISQLFNVSFTDTYSNVWYAFWLGDISSILIVTPLVIYWAIKPFLNWNLFTVLEAILLLVSLYFVTDYWLSTKLPLLFLFIPILVWAAFRFNHAGSSTVLFIITAAMIHYVLAGKSYQVPGSEYINLFFISAVMSIAAFMTYFIALAVAERDKAKANLATYNMALEEKVRERTKEMQRNIQKVQKMQKQIVTQEKLASLGTLTAGIAHEIKNPLNFIENFSDLCVKQVNRLSDQILSQKEKIDEAAYAEIERKVDLLKLNLNKIIEYGKKADFIIESMLMHAREKSGAAQMVDINQLFDEYLKLSYHVARHKTPGFNVILNTTYDKTIDKVQIIPNDVSRVFLNLLNNAFYSLQEKKKKLGDQYQAFLNVKTANLGEYISISIYDNGMGISNEVKKKLFTPFFTTKPAGEGTGLGLSISHDIIVSSHGGSIKVDAKPGEYAEFTIILPKKREVITPLEEEKEER